MTQQNFEIAVAESNIDWTGRKVTGAHWGTIGIKKGTLAVEDGKVSGGRFSIDTTSIRIIDVTNPAIKNITHLVEFDADIDIAGDTLTASGKIKIDRTQYGMKFRSGNFFQNLGDTLIYNDIDLNINIIAKAV